MITEEILLSYVPVTETFASGYNSRTAEKTDRNTTLLSTGISTDESIWDIYPMEQSKLF